MGRTVNDSILIKEDTLNIFTDGSSKGSPRVGGVGIHYVWINSNGYEDEYDLDEVGYERATNNQMELKACVIALKSSTMLEEIPRFLNTIIYSDSQYVVKNEWNSIKHWPGNRWRNRYQRPIDNVNLWKELVREKIKLYNNYKIQVRYIWVRGHAKSKHNKIADRLAKESARKPFNPPLTYVAVRRKITKEVLKLGCVPMKGERITIRIITSEKLPQGEWKYKYEVVSKKSNFHGKVDQIYFEKLFEAGHSYYVVVSNDNNYPK